MRLIRMALGVLLLLGVALGLHYYLPSRDVVRIVGTEIARVGVTGENAAGDEVTRTRDVRYIKAVTPSGVARVYRNEDTGWGWPPYLKFESANLAAEADAAVSTAEAPKWMIVSHYGWRVPIVSAFPNAVALWPASGPDQSTVVWVKWVAIGAALLALLVLRRFVLMLFR